MLKDILKSLSCAVIVAALAVGMTACGDKTPNSSTPTSSEPSSSASSDISAPESTAADPTATGDATSTAGNGTTTQNTKTQNTKASTNTKATSGQTTQPDNGVAPAKFRGTTFEYLTWTDTRQSGDTVNEENKVFSDFEKATGVTVKPTKIAYSTFDETLASRMSAGNIPDMLYLNGLILPRMQYLQPISGLGYDFSDSKVWDQDTMKNYTVKGKSYGFNLTGSKTLMYRPKILCYNKAELKKYELEDPYTLWKQGKWTMKKLISMSKTYYKKTGNPGYSVGSFWEYAQLQGMQGAFAFDGTTVKNNLTEKKFSDTMGEVLDWKEAGFLSSTLSDATRFDNGKQLFFSYNASVMRDGNALFANMKKKGQLGVAPMPAIDGQSTQYMLGEQSAFGVLKGAKNAELAPYFVKYYADKSHYNESKWFFSDEALAVYNESVSRKKLADTGFLAGQYQTSSAMEYVENAIFGGTKAQLATNIEKFGTSNVKPEIKRLEELLKNFS